MAGTELYSQSGRGGPEGCAWRRVVHGIPVEPCQGLNLYSFTPDTWSGSQMMDVSDVINTLHTVITGDVDKCPDLSLIGRPLTVGEWGVVIHPGLAQAHQGLTSSEGDTSFLVENCLMFGMGAAQVRQWDWRDLSPWETWLFDWGSVHSQDFIPKDAGKIIRALYVLLRMPEPSYQVPPAALLIPTSHRRGSSYYAIGQAVGNSNTLMAASRVEYSPISEDCLDRLPKAFTRSYGLCLTAPATRRWPGGEVRERRRRALCVGGRQL